jgi:hypothetical protein
VLDRCVAEVGLGHMSAVEEPRILVGSLGVFVEGMPGSALVVAVLVVAVAPEQGGEPLQLIAARYWHQPNPAGASPGTQRMPMVDAS